MATAQLIDFNSVSRSDMGNTGYDAMVTAITNAVYNVWQLTIGDYLDQTYTVTLDSVDYDVRLRWNTRDQAWNAQIGLSGDDPAFGFKCVNGLNLLAPYSYIEACPPGQLYFIDAVKVQGRPDYENSGVDKRFQLIYIDAQESQA
ncbi:hypothetical protein [Pantoea sp. ME81]|uniref:phage baseplate plug family protein n=1 Tax=Pantoea sp. ME81 TaxID=2743935 RepID=UPI0015F390B0|nr:hypothetical protein [Pantoea sp. ME81]